MSPDFETEARAMPVVSIPPPYRGPTGGVGEVKVAAGTLLECLQSVEDRYPGVLPFVVDSEGRVHRFVKIFVNGEELDRAGALSTPVAQEDRVDLLAAIGGG
jgi:molybdopterin converting factor small subunit